MHRLAHHNDWLGNADTFSPTRFIISIKFEHGSEVFRLLLILFFIMIVMDLSLLFLFLFLCYLDYDVRTHI